MKKLIFTAVVITALIAFASCAKQTDDYIAPAEKNGGEVTVSFVAEPNMSDTRAFFDTAGTEPWEKSLRSVTVLTFNDAGALLAFVHCGRGDGQESDVFHAPLGGRYDL